MTTSPATWNDRLIEIRRMRVGEIAGHARNPKTHPPRQRDALTDILAAMGKADVLKAYYSERNDGALTLYDGHARQSLDPDQEWPVAIFDLTDAEADDWLRYADPIAALAETDTAVLDALLRDASTDSTLLAELLSERGAAAGLFAGTPVDPADLWKGMPDFEQEDKTAYQSITVHFKDQGAVEDFARLIDQTITDRTRYLWFPFIEIERYADKNYSDEP